MKPNKPLNHTLVDDKIENINIENDLEKRKKLIEHSIQETEQSMSKLMESISLLKQEIQNRKLMIDCYQSIDTSEYEKPVPGVIFKKKKIPDEKLMMMRKLSLMRERDADILKAQIEDLEKVKNRKNKEYEEMSNKLNAKKQELKTVKLKLLNHYHNLLQEGRDTRYDSP